MERKGNYKEYDYEINIKPIRNFLFCPHCKDFIGLKSDELKDNTSINCSKCHNDFIFIICHFCNKNVFMKTKTYKYGYHIKCPYNDCKKIFSKFKCDKCDEIYGSGSYAQGDPISKCNQLCLNEINLITCPNINCQNLIKFVKLYSDEVSVTCNSLKCNGLTFQRIQCNYCRKNLIFKNENIYIEGQYIECPYEDCQKIYKKIKCVKCSVSKIKLMQKGEKSLDEMIKCHNCESSFTKIAIPTIGSIQFTQKYTEGSLIKIGYHKNVNILNCNFCLGKNIWANGDYQIGQLIICANRYCAKQYRKSFCTQCNSEILSIKNGDFSYSKAIRCKCGNFNSIFICPYCLEVHCKTGIYNNGWKLTCHLNETMKFFNFSCPHCFNIILDKGARYLFGQKIICPYNECTKSFNFLYCFHCSEGIYYSKADYIEGQIIKCVLPECMKTSALVYCSSCIRPIHYDSPKNNLSNSELICIYSDCGKKFHPGLIQNEFLKPKDVILPVQGRELIYSKPEKDPLDLEYLKAITHLEIYDTLSLAPKHWNNYLREINKKECIICANDNVEAVFVPCGHRITCVKCAYKIRKEAKKCPVCKANIENILEKIYDS